MSDQIVQLDERWVTRAFLVTDKNFSKLDLRNTMWSSASLKFTDTTIGGNFAVNSPPQFTKFCDIPVASRTGQPRGMGRYYSEAIDDKSQLVYFRMGIPRFNTLATFYTSAYNAEAGLNVRGGRLNKTLFMIGKAVGFVVSIMSFKLLMVRAIAEGIRLMSGAPKSKYFYLSPTMHNYWQAVATMLNQIAVNRGIVPRIGGNGSTIFDREYEFDEAAKLKIHNALPDVFNKSGSIDVYATVNKANRMLRRREKEKKQMADSLDTSSGIDLGQYVKSFEDNQTKVLDPGSSGMQSYLEKYYDTAQSQTGSDALGRDQAKDVETAEGGYSMWDKLKEFFEAEANDGGQFAVFRVNYTGTVSESFSNSVGDSELKGKLDGLVASARSINFNLAGGNVTEGVGQIFEGLKSFVQGSLDSLGVGGLAAVGGAAFFDIPKVWENSTASLPRSNYTIKLNSPYGNPISQLFNIYFPLCMLLAMGLPLSTGKQSYTSPFVLEYYDPGRAQSRLGMIDSINVTRGTSSLGFNEDNKALAIDVSFSIIDLTSIMHMPISMGISPANDLFNVVTGGAAGAVAGVVLGPAGAVAGATVGAALAEGINGGFFDDATAYSDYLAVLAGMGVNDQIYWSRRLKLALTRKLENWRQWASVSNFASWTGDGVPGRVASIFYPGVPF